MEFGGEVFFREQWRGIQVPQVQKISREYLRNLFSCKQRNLVFNSNQQAARGCMDHTEKSICEVARGIVSVGFGRLMGDDGFGKMHLSQCDFAVRAAVAQQSSDKKQSNSPLISKFCPLGFSGKTTKEIEKEFFGFRDVLEDIMSNGRRRIIR
jgi:hypothetical protein